MGRTTCRSYRVSESREGGQAGQQPFANFFVKALLFLILLTSCAKEQSFYIISAYDGIGEYAQMAKAESDPDLVSLYQRYVLDPYWDDCAEGGEYVLLAKDALESPIHDFDLLLEQVNILRDSDVDTIARNAVEKASKLLPGPDTTICIFAGGAPSKASLGRDLGVDGFTAGSGKVILQIHPQGDWQDAAAYFAARGYHQSVWTARHFKEYSGFDLLGYLLYEGRADAFARLIVPQVQPDWIDALTPNQELEAWQDMQSQLNTKNYVIQKRYVLGDGGRIPLWTGYTIGFHIAQSFLTHHPEISIDEWTSLDPQDLLIQSGYQGVQ